MNNIQQLQDDSFIEKLDNMMVKLEQYTNIECVRINLGLLVCAKYSHGDFYTLVWDDYSTNTWCAIWYDRNYNPSNIIHKIIETDTIDDSILYIVISNPEIDMS